MPFGAQEVETMSPKHYNEPGSSPAMAIVVQPRCEPINAGLIRTQRPI
jgi:hypothetical protein